MSDFLKDLSEQKTKKPLPLSLRIFRLFVLILVYASICIGVVGIRGDLFQVMHTMQFWLEFCLILITTFFAVILSIKLTTPGEERSISNFSLRVSIVSWVALNICLLIMNPSFFPDTVLAIFNKCFRSVFFITLTPAAILTIYSVKKGIFYPKWLGLCIFLLSSMSAGVFLHLSCPSSNPAHNLGSHTLPILLIAVLGGIIFKVLVQKNRK